MLADSDHNGVLSFAEYFLFTSLMSAEDAFLKVRSPFLPWTNPVKISFKLFDINGDGYISLDEFREIIKMHTLSSEAATGSPKVEPNLPEKGTDDNFKDEALENIIRVFGDEGKKKLNYSEFIDLLKILNNEVLVQQFKVGPRFFREKSCHVVTVSSFSK